MGAQPDKTMKRTAVAVLVALLASAALAFVLRSGLPGAPELRGQSAEAPRVAAIALDPVAPGDSAPAAHQRGPIEGPSAEEVEEGAIGRRAGVADDALAGLDGVSLAEAPPVAARAPARPALAPLAPPATAVASAPSPTAAAHGYGTLGTGAGMGALAAAPPPPATRLPTSGVLASTFVGGHGAASRLEDLMDRGVMVDGERVRLGAFEPIGHLPYAVPAHDAVALYAELERTRLREDGEHVHMQIALVAREGERPRRPRMDVRLVVDCSGSMEGEKFRSAVAAAHALVDRLAPTDTFGLVSYSDVASIELAAGRVGDRAAAHAAIDRLRLGGGTNVGAALDAVASNPPVRRRATDVLLVMLLSDGMANVGITDAETLASQSRAMFESAGILTTTIGVGTDFDETTMLAIAREGSGSYEFVRRSADIAGILTQELDERAMAVAQDLRLRIELAPGVSLARVYGSRVLDDQEAARVRATEVAVDARLARELGIPQDRQHDDDTGLRMHIPSFRRGDQHVVLLELVVPPGTGDTQVARVSLDYKDLRDEANAHEAVQVHSERTSDLEVASTSVRSPVKRTVLAFQAADTLREASEALASGDTARADAVLGERITLLETASRVWHDPSMGRDARLLTSYRQAVDGAWRDWDDSSRHTLVLAMGYYGDQRMD